MPDKGAHTSLTEERRVNIDTGQAMGHLTTFVVSNDLHVMPFVATFHDLKQLARFVKRLPHAWHQFGIVVLCESQKFIRFDFQRLEQKFDVLFFLFFRRDLSLRWLLSG